MEVLNVGDNAQVFQDIIRREQVVSLERAEMDAVVNKERQAPAPTRARSITMHHGIRRYRDGAGAICHFCFLDSCYTNFVKVEEVSEFGF